MNSTEVLKLVDEAKRAMRQPPSCQTDAIRALIRIAEGLASILAEEEEAAERVRRRLHAD